MVAICILDALEDVGIDFPHEGGLLIRKNVFNGLNGEGSRHQIIWNNTSPVRGFTFWTTRHPYI